MGNRNSKKEKFEPIKSLEGLLKWTITDYKDNSNKLIYQLESGIPSSGDQDNSKVLFCHDMAGGYLDDALLEANDNVFAYRFYNWHLTDCFVYFSHEFVSMPPPSWVRLARMHGASCLGTVIMEAGATEDIFNSIFQSSTPPVTVDKFMHRLNDVRTFYGFDGWLINFEVSFSTTSNKEVVEKIQKFLADLRALGNEVIWYDAVTVNGDLHWQNCLNKENYSFFISSGKQIFLNYGWNKNLLCDSSRMDSGSGIYVGVDCFGRGCPGGGGLGCDKALEIIRGSTESPNILSTAMFAAGWTYESVLKTNKKMEKKKHKYLHKLDQLNWEFYRRVRQGLSPVRRDSTKLYRSLPAAEALTTFFGLGQFYDDGTIGYNWLQEQQVFPTGIPLVKNRQNNIEILQLLPERRCGLRFGTGCAKIVLSPAADLNTHQQPCSDGMELYRCNVSVKVAVDWEIQLIIGRTGVDLHSGVLVCLTFSFCPHGDPEMQTRTIELGLAERVTKDISVPSSHAHSIRWCQFLKNKLNSELPSDSSQITLRIVGLRFTNVHVLQTFGPLYLGYLHIGQSSSPSLL